MKAGTKICTWQRTMFVTPPLYLDYIPVLIMKSIGFENIYTVFRPVTYIVCKYNRETNINTPVVKKA